VFTYSPVLYFETCRARKWGKTKEKGGAAYEASSYFIERDISEKRKISSEN
jgi:hypothetical protein